MPAADFIQTNFTAGELSPLMYGRVDFNKYKNGVKTLQNFLVKPQGGAVRCPGTQYVSAARAEATSGILLRDFTFSVSQAYTLEFTDITMRIYTAGGRVDVSPGVPVEVITPWAGADVHKLSFAQSADVLYVACAGYPPQMISRLSNTSWSCADVPFIDGPYLDALNPEEAAVLQVATTSTTWDTVTLTALAAFTFVVGRYVEFMLEGAWKLASIGGNIVGNGAPGAHANGIINYAPIKQLPEGNQVSYTYTGTTTPGLTLTVTSPYSMFSSQDINSILRIKKDLWIRIDAITNAAVVTGTMLFVTAYATPANSIGYSNIFREVVVSLVSGTWPITANDQIYGRSIRMFIFGQWIWGNITSYTGYGPNTAQVHLTSTNYIGTPLPFDPNGVSAFPIKGGGTMDAWRLGAFRNDTTLGPCYPAAVCLHQGRLWFGGTPDQPMTFWGSRANDYLDFRPTEYDVGAPVLDDDAVTATIADGQIDTIKWMVSGLYMMVGTGGGDYLVNAGQTPTAITPTSISVTKQSMHGSLNQHVLYSDLSFIHVDRTGTRLDEMTYQYLQNAYVPLELSLLSEHLFTEPGIQIQNLAIQRVPTQIIWVLGTDGSLFGCTRLRDQEVVAWFRRPLNNGTVLSMCVIPSANGMADTLYLAVQRVINGSTVVYIEILTPEYRAISTSDITPFIFVDCSLSYSGAPATTITGLDHLIGEAVQVMANGVYTGTQVVSVGGTVTVPAGTTTAHVGYSIDSKIVTLNTEGGSPLGSSQGRLSRVQAAIVRLYQSFAFYYGVTGKPDNNTTPVRWQYSAESGAVYSPPRLLTGDVRVELQQESSRDNTYTIQQTEPYPLTVNALISELIVNVP